MSLSGNVMMTRDGFRLDVALAVDDGEVVVLLGPNGAGKSTLLGVVAGLLRPDRGRLVSNDVVLLDTDGGVHLAPQDRHVGMVVPDYMLFRHLNVLENVAFGLRARGVPRDTARHEAASWLARLDLEELSRRRPSTLSGGQAQRVALARALAGRPQILLLDEPLAALDAGTRPAVRADLRRHLAGFEGASLLVTHDPLEALVLADRIVVLEDGLVVQQGPPAELARRPRTEYVARVVGLNLLRGVATGRAATAGTAPVTLAHDAVGPVYLAFAPTAVTLSPTRPAGSARNSWPGVVADLEPNGDLVRVTIDGDVSLRADVTPLAVADLSLEPGVAVWSSVKATEINVYPA